MTPLTAKLPRFTSTLFRLQRVLSRLSVTSKQRIRSSAPLLIVAFNEHCCSFCPSPPHSRKPISHPLHQRPGRLRAVPGRLCPVRARSGPTRTPQRRPFSSASIRHSQPVKHDRLGGRTGERRSISAASPAPFEAFRARTDLRHRKGSRKLGATEHERRMR